MSQSVNLLQNHRRRQQAPLCAMHIVGIAGVWVLVLIGMNFWSHHQQGSLKASIAKLQTQLSDTQEAYQALQVKLPKESQTSALKETIAKLKADKEEKQALIKALERQEVKRSGFATLLTGLANQHIEGLWFDEFRFADGGRDLSIHGKTVAANLVFDWIEQASQLPELKGKSFQTVAIEQAKEDNQPLTFVLSTQVTQVETDN